MEYATAPELATVVVGTEVVRGGEVLELVEEVVVEVSSTTVVEVVSGGCEVVGSAESDWAPQLASSRSTAASEAERFMATRSDEPESVLLEQQ